MKQNIITILLALLIVGKQRENVTVEELMMKCMDGVKDDPSTYDILKDYLKDEEEDFYWSQGAVELIKKIGAQNWLLLQP